MTAPVRMPIYNELLACSVQSGIGSQVLSPATADLIDFLTSDLNPQFENLKRADKGLGRSMFGFIKGGKTSAQWNIDTYLTLSNASTPTAPLAANLIQGAFCSTPVTFQDTVQASPTPTASSFAVGSAATLKVGDPVACNIGGSTGWQVRPIASISTNTLTFSIPFSAAPTSGQAVQSLIYRFNSSQMYWLTLTNWIRSITGADSNYSIAAVDAAVGQMTIDFMSDIIKLTCSGPAGKVYEPGSGVITIPTLPTNWITGFAPQASQFGEAFFDTTAVTLYSLSVKLNNNAKALPVPFGSQYPDGTIFGMRELQTDITMDGADINASFLTDSEQKNPHALFAHSGTTQGQFCAVFCPKMWLARNDYDKSQETLRLSFANSELSATLEDNDITLAFA